jgi:hypothetical protein
LRPVGSLRNKERDFLAPRGAGQDFSTIGHTIIKFLTSVNRKFFNFCSFVNIVIVRATGTLKKIPTFFRFFARFPKDDQENRKF